MSTMSRFCRSCGSTSPNALPTSFSYWPTPGHEKPPKVGDSVAVISIRVTRASANGAAKTPASESAIRVLFIASSPLFDVRLKWADRQHASAARAALVQVDGLLLAAFFLGRVHCPRRIGDRQASVRLLLQMDRRIGRQARLFLPVASASGTEDLANKQSWPTIR